MIFPKPRTRCAQCGRHVESLVSIRGGFHAATPEPARPRDRGVPRRRVVWRWRHRATGDHRAAVLGRHRDRQPHHHASRRHHRRGDRTDDDAARCRRPVTGRPLDTSRLGAGDHDARTVLRADAQALGVPAGGRGHRPRHHLDLHRSRSPRHRGLPPSPSRVLPRRSTTNPIDLDDRWLDAVVLRRWCGYFERPDRVAVPSGRGARSATQEWCCGHRCIGDETNGQPRHRLRLRARRWRLSTARWIARLPARPLVCCRHGVGLSAAELGRWWQIARLADQPDACQ